MKILVNATPLKGLVTGISRYLSNLCREMERLPDTEVFYFDGFRVCEKMPAGARPHEWIRKTDRIWKLPAPMVTALRVGFLFVYERNLKRVLKKRRFDVYHDAGFFPCDLKGLDVAQAFTLHDLSLIKLKRMHTRDRALFHDLFFKRRIFKADQVITPSEYIRREFCEETGFLTSRVSAIAEACDPFFVETGGREKPGRLPPETSGEEWPEKYFLFAGTLEPRKNLSLALEALEMAKNDASLVIVGWEGWGDKSCLEKARRSLGRRIVVRGYLDDALLRALYQNALALVYPSFYEGFGLPLLEAMSLGCPVICSHTSALPEVAGDAAFFIHDLHDPRPLAGAMDRVAADDFFREKLRQKGRDRAKGFSWKKTAAQTREVFEKAMERSVS
ncbi:Glycosyltransferase family 1 protein [Candidatus Desulfarcum epimagneticum]|uniref:Glycosyltransferase family 1 protein n=1 Tax=uncultured Desulfobacteraceae bacterium TaxID=218296 RepID=A0A484HII8_9BACT|nr:Glycosyltransferase family 1 protein [uncultured Desulfobacteraceae bacterium]